MCHLGMAKILLGRGPNKESAFLDVTPIHLEVKLICYFRTFFVQMLKKKKRLINFHYQHSSEYPALTSALNLLDEVFDLQARSQWLRRGLINRLLGMLIIIIIIMRRQSFELNQNCFRCSVSLNTIPESGAPWVSQAANKRITQAAKTAIEVDKIEHLLRIVL